MRLRAAFTEKVVGQVYPVAWDSTIDDELSLLHVNVEENASPLLSVISSTHVGNELLASSVDV